MKITTPWEKKAISAESSECKNMRKTCLILHEKNIRNISINFFRTLLSMLRLEQFFCHGISIMEFIYLKFRYKIYGINLKFQNCSTIFTRFFISSLFSSLSLTTTSMSLLEGKLFSLLFFLHFNFFSFLLL